MNYLTQKNRTKISASAKSDQGFSLIESAVALTIMAFILAASAPTFLYSKINNDKNTLKTAALAVAQRVVDEKRGSSFDSIGKNIAGTANIEQESIPITMSGRPYSTLVSYPCNTAPVPTDCNVNYKLLDLSITDIKTSKVVYMVQVGLTSFQ